MTFKIAATKIVQAFVTVNGVQVGKVVEETPEEKSRALLAHDIQTNEARQRYAKSQMEIDINTLKRENASLKNQVNQLKLKLEKFYAQTDSAKENPTYPNRQGPTRRENSMNVPRKPRKSIIKTHHQRVRIADFESCQPAHQLQTMKTMMRSVNLQSPHELILLE